MRGGGDGEEDRAKLGKADTEWHNYGTIWHNMEEDRQVERSTQLDRSFRSCQHLASILFHMQYNPATHLTNY
jgi:hypothetical protein